MAFGDFMKNIPKARKFVHKKVEFYCEILRLKKPKVYFTPVHALKNTYNKNKGNVCGIASAYYNEIYINLKMHNQKDAKIYRNKKRQLVCKNFDGSLEQTIVHELLHIKFQSLRENRINEKANSIIYNVNRFLKI